MAEKGRYRKIELQVIRSAKSKEESSVYELPDLQGVNLDEVDLAELVLLVIRTGAKAQFEFVAIDEKAWKEFRPVRANCIQKVHPRRFVPGDTVVFQIVIPGYGS
jgi:hypothetical protein